MVQKWNHYKCSKNLIYFFPHVNPKLSKKGNQFKPQISNGLLKSETKGQHVKAKIKTFF